MAQNTLFDYRKTNGSPSRNVFDLSRRDEFGCNIGELIPCFCQEVVPGDKFEVSVTNLVRVMPLVSSPFVRMKQHIDFYFVPYEQLWSNWLNFVNMKDDKWSSAQKSRTFIPHCTGADFNLLAETQWSVNGLFTSSLLSHFKLLDMLGYGSQYWNQNHSMPTYNGSRKYNIFRIAAYNKIWYDYYRQKYYDDGKIGLEINDNPAMLFNFDDLTCDTEANAKVATKRLSAMLQMRYRCWKKDLFTGLLPTTQQGAVSSVLSPVSVNTLTDFSPSNQGYNILFGSTSNGRLTRGTVGSVPTSGAGSVNGVNVTSLTGNGTFDILEFRRANAVQKWRENALRAGNRVEDSQRVRFGKEPHYHNDVHPAFLGSVSSNLQMSDINSTSQNGDGVNQSLGDYVGKGIMTFDGKAFKFDTGDNGDYGVIMGIYSVLPDMEYNARGVDYCNCLLEPEDFYQPEYDKTGFQSVPHETFYAFYPHTTPRGFAPNYWYYKSVLDKDHGEFMRDNVLYGNMAHWSAPNPQVQDTSTNPTLQQFYVDYRYYNQLFVVPPDMRIDDEGIVEINNFAVNLFIECKAVRPMSVLGLPEI